MKNYFFIIWIIVIMLSCKKKTDVKITVFNPYIQKFVQNAKVSIIEAREANFFTSGWGRQYDKSKTISTIATDVNGVVFFDDEKLRLNSKYDYWVTLDESWGRKNRSFDRSAYPLLNKGRSNSLIICDYTKGTAKIQFHNLFVPSQSGDSISIYPYWFDLYDPLLGAKIKGSGIYETHISHDAFVSLPSNYSFSSYEDNAYGKALLTIRKKKLGVLTFDTLTVQFLPAETVTIDINW